MSTNLNALGPKRVVQMLLGAGALVLVVGAVIMFLMNSQIHDLQATVSSKEALVGSSEQTARKLDQTQKDYDEISSRTQYLEASVSAKSFVPTLLKQLQALAAATRLTVTTVRPGLVTSPAPPAPAAGTPAAGADSSVPPTDAKKAPPPPYDTLDIGVDVVGTYPDTAAFLYNLTRFPKIISVASVQMHPGAAAAPGAVQSAPSVTTNLHLTAFIFHGDADTPPAAGGTPAVFGTATTAAAVSPAAAPAPSGAPATPQSAPLSAVSGAAAHAAGQAVGATNAAKARSEVGIQTL